MLGLRYFAMLCNDVEDKSMDQVESWSVVWCTDTYKDLLQEIRLGLLIFYDNSSWGRCFFQNFGTISFSVEQNDLALDVHKSLSVTGSKFVLTCLGSLEVRTLRKKIDYLIRISTNTPLTSDWLFLCLWFDNFLWRWHRVSHFQPPWRNCSWLATEDPCARLPDL